MRVRESPDASRAVLDKAIYNKILELLMLQFSLKN